MLKVNNLSKSWKDFKLKNVSFEIDKEYCVILGPSGAGKSVLIKCIAGILKPDSGKIILNGDDITNLPPEKRNVGYVPQNYALFPNKNVYKNIAYGLIIKKSSKLEIDRKVKEIAEFLNISHLLDRDVKTLSGGEQQMLAIARGLMSNPRLLLMDEPSLGLAPILVKSIFETIKTINESGVTVLLVEQNAKAALKLANRGYVMEVGNIVLEDESSNLLTNPQVRKAYLGG